MTDETRGKGAGEGRHAQLLKGLAELALLSLLEERAHYGLDILERLRSEAGLGLAEGTIYPLLHRLERAGLTKAEWRLEESSTHPRKYYALTDRGRTELTSQLTDWRRLSGALATFFDRRKS
jgi:PadR family transcriptional regulator PadR